MMKSNWLVAGIAAVACVVLLVLWIVLGFNYVDDPLDLIIAIIWVAAIALICTVIAKMEKRRKIQMMTTFVGDGVLYNTETGLIKQVGPIDQVIAVEGILSRMKFPFSIKELPEDASPKFDWIVYTDKFADGGSTWEGEVAPVDEPEDKVKFGNRTELSKLIAA